MKFSVFQEFWFSREDLVDPSEAFKDYIGQLALASKAFSILACTDHKDNPRPDNKLKAT